MEVLIRDSQAGTLVYLPFSALVPRPLFLSFPAVLEATAWSANFPGYDPRLASHSAIATGQLGRGS